MMLPLRQTLSAAALIALVSSLTMRAHAAPIFLDDEAESSTNIAWDLPRPTAPQTLVFDYKDAKNFYALDVTPTDATFSRVLAGTKKTLNSAPVKWQAKNEVVLQRRPWLMQLVVDDEIALRGFDASFDAGKIGGAPAGWGELRVQPLEAVRFDDDFTRLTGAGDDLWKTTGQWALSTSSEHISEKNANMSSNPFAYQVTSPKSESLATTGRWFWDSYDARVAVRPGGSGQIGVAAYVKDAKNYLAFRWSSEEGADGNGARQLVRVTDGKTTVLAQGKGAFLPKQWYKLGLRTSPGYIEAILDGVPVLRANNEALGQGGVGLWAKDMDAAEFDDVEVRSYDFLRTSFSDNGAWERAGGQWTLANGVASGGSNKDAHGLLVTGARDWDGYRAHISAQLKPGATLGYAVGVRDAKNYTAFQIASDNKARIVRVVNGASKTLFEGEANLSEQTNKDGFARFQIDARNGALRVKAGDQLIAQASAPGLTNGRFGLIAQGDGPASIAFKDAVIYFPPPPAPPKVASKMEDDAYMVGWASPTGAWPPSPGPGGLEFWNTGDFFGDTTLDFPWRASWPDKSKFEVALRAKRGDFDSGYLLRAIANKEAKKLDWTLLRGDKTLASAAMPFADLPDADSPEGGMLHLQMTSNGLMLLAGENPVLSYLDPAPPRGTSLGVRSSGVRVRAEKLAATTANRDDYTFTEAPVDFYAPSGRWNVFSRWPCYGDWSFFGGTGRHPTLWSKRTYGGDIVAEFYAHPQMDLPKEPGYSHPGDLNVSICGDGKNPASGYSFIVSGRANTATQIMRGDKVVAERRDEDAFFHNTINHNMAWHKTWFYIRASARAAKKDGVDGVMITLMRDEKKLLEFFDADPLPLYKEGGRVAFWTLDSTMMIARAKIEAEKLGLRALPQGLMEAAYVDLNEAPKAGGLAPVSVVETEVKTAIVEAGAANWTITNPVSGGIFAVDLNRAPLTATPATKFALNAAMPDDVKVDLYVEIDGQWHTIQWSGGQKPDPMAPTLTALSKTGEGNRYSADIGAALAKEFPGQKEWKVTKLRIGAMQGDPYRWIGFDGNGMDASYRIANLDWSGVELN